MSVGINLRTHARDWVRLREGIIVSSLVRIAQTWSGQTGVQLILEGAEELSTNFATNPRGGDYEHRPGIATLRICPPWMIGCCELITWLADICSSYFVQQLCGWARNNLCYPASFSLGEKKIKSVRSSDQIRDPSAMCPFVKPACFRHAKLAQNYFNMIMDFIS